MKKMRKINININIKINTYKKDAPQK